MSLAATLFTLFIIGIVSKQSADGSEINSSVKNKKVIVEEKSGQDTEGEEVEAPSIEEKHQGEIENSQ